MSTDDRDRGGFVWPFALLLGALTVAAIVIALLGSLGDDDDDGLADAPAPTAPAQTATAPTATAPAPPATAPDAEPIPVEVQEDPVVKRLARGRELPFTAGPWARAAWRDSVYGRLRPATQDRAERVPLGDGFGILIQ